LVPTIVTDTPASGKVIGTVTVPNKEFNRSTLWCKQASTHVQPQFNADVVVNCWPTQSVFVWRTVRTKVLIKIKD
jgi:hypothetical protein